MDHPVPDCLGNPEAFQQALAYHPSIDNLMEMTLRKPRDFDAELKALDDKAKELKTRKVQQLGELVIATGADALSPDELAGALVALAETQDAPKREEWAKRGAMFYEGRTRRSQQVQRPARSTDSDTGGAQTQSGSAQSSSSRAGST